MMTWMRTSKFLSLALVLAAQTAWSAPEFNRGEKIVCETRKFDYAPDGEILSSRNAHAKGDLLSLRILPVPLSTKNRAAKIDLSRGHGKGHMNVYKKTRIRRIEPQDLNSILTLQDKLAATPLTKESHLKRGYSAIYATYGLTKVNGANEAVLFNDENHPNALGDVSSPFSYYLTLRWTEQGRNLDRTASHLVTGVLSSGKNQSPLFLKFRCFARGI